MCFKCKNEINIKLLLEINKKESQLKITFKKKYCLATI